MWSALDFIARDLSISEAPDDDSDMKPRLFFTLMGLVLLVFAALPLGVLAFDQPPWDTGHETIQITLGSENTNPGPSG